MALEEREDRDAPDHRAELGLESMEARDVPAAFAAFDGAFTAPAETGKLVDPSSGLNDTPGPAGGGIDIGGGFTVEKLVDPTSGINDTPGPVGGTVSGSASFAVQDDVFLAPPAVVVSQATTTSPASSQSAVASGGNVTGNVLYDDNGVPFQITE